MLKWAYFTGFGLCFNTTLFRLMGAKVDVPFVLLFPFVLCFKDLSVLDWFPISWYSQSNYEANQDTSHDQKWQPCFQKSTNTDIFSMDQHKKTEFDHIP